MFGPYLKPFIELDGLDLNQKAFSLSWDFEANAVEFGAYGDLTQINKGGVKNWAVQIQMNAEFSTSVDAKLFNLVGVSTGVVKWRPSSTAGVSNTNPQYAGTCLVESFGPAEGDWGERSVFTLSLVSAGELSRSTST